MVFCGNNSSSAFSSSSPCNLQAVGPGDSKSYVGGDGASARVSALCKRHRCGGGGVQQLLLSQTFVPANSSPKLSQGLLLKTPNGAPRGHRSTLSVRSEHDNKRVVCFGEMLIDFVPTVGGVSLAEALAFKKAPRGAPANVAVGIARLGGNATFVGKVIESILDALCKLGTMNLVTCWLMCSRRMELKPRDAGLMQMQGLHSHLSHYGMMGRGNLCFIIIQVQTCCLSPRNLIQTFSKR